MKTQFIHITLSQKSDENGQPETSLGGVTLAIRKFEGRDLDYEVGAAFCSPTEQHFIRKKGRMIAEGRLNARRHGYFSFTRESNEKPLSLSESPKEVVGILPFLHAKRRAQVGLPGPSWWLSFVTVAQERFSSPGKVSMGVST